MKCTTKSRAEECQQFAQNLGIQATASDVLDGGTPWEMARIDEHVKPCYGH